MWPAGRGPLITFLVALLRTNYETGVAVRSKKKTGGTSSFTTTAQETVPCYYHFY